MTTKKINHSAQIWIDAAYSLFASEGPASLKVEVLAKKVGISKSSFYHHFADLESFEESLLDQHLRQAQLIALAEAQCSCIDPELIQLLVQHKMDLLFNRQLRVARNQSRYQDCLERSNQITGIPFIQVWMKEMELEHKPHLAAAFFELALENFYLQLTEENLNHEWLSAYFKHLRTLVQRIKNA